MRKKLPTVVSLVVGNFVMVVRFFMMRFLMVRFFMVRLFMMNFFVMRFLMMRFFMMVVVVMVVLLFVVVLFVVVFFVVVLMLVFLDVDWHMNLDRVRLLDDFLHSVGHRLLNLDFDGVVDFLLDMDWNMNLFLDLDRVGHFDFHGVWHLLDHLHGHWNFDELRHGNLLLDVNWNVDLLLYVDSVRHLLLDVDWVRLGYVDSVRHLDWNLDFIRNVDFLLNVHWVRLVDVHRVLFNLLDDLFHVNGMRHLHGDFVRNWNLLLHWVWHSLLNDLLDWYMNLLDDWVGLNLLLDESDVFVVLMLVMLMFMVFVNFFVTVVLLMMLFFMMLDVPVMLLTTPVMLPCQARAHKERKNQNR